MPLYPKSNNFLHLFLSFANISAFKISSPVWPIIFNNFNQICSTLSSRLILPTAKTQGTLWWWALRATQDVSQQFPSCKCCSLWSWANIASFIQRPIGYHAGLSDVHSRPTVLSAACVELREYGWWRGPVGVIVHTNCKLSASYEWQSYIVYPNLFGKSHYPEWLMSFVAHIRDPSSFVEHRSSSDVFCYSHKRS